MRVSWVGNRMGVVDNSCMVCVSVGLGSTRLLCHVKVHIRPILSHQELALGDLRPGAIAKERAGVRADHGQEDRADRECLAAARVSMKACLTAPTELIKLGGRGRLARVRLRSMGLSVVVGVSSVVSGVGVRT